MKEKESPVQVQKGSLMEEKENHQSIVSQKKKLLKDC
jgi:hypothetical protein